MRLDVLPARSGALERLQRAEIDCCFTAATARVPRDLELDRLGDDGFVCMVSKKHPFARRMPDLPAFLRARHALIAPSGQRGGFVDHRFPRRAQNALCCLSFLIFFEVEPGFHDPSLFGANVVARW